VCRFVFAEYDVQPQEYALMAKCFHELNETLTKFISAQKIFFVASAAAEGRINLSPKGYDSLRVLDSRRIVWLNLSGSGNETAAHLLASNRMTLMFCAFEDPPLILRIYGSAKTIHRRDREWNELITHFGQFPGARQIFDLRVESAQTSCGFGVPYFEFSGERCKLLEHFRAKGEEAIERGWAEKNTLSIDGLNSGIIDPG
jgi:hypothetical protein